MKRALPILSFAIFTIVVVGFFMARVVQEDRAAQNALTGEPSIYGKRGKVIGKMYSTVSDDVFYIYSAEKQHRFPNGRVGEGWLVELVATAGQGDPIWVVAPKGRVEWLVSTNQHDAPRQ